MRTACLRDLTRWLFGRLQRVRVHGESMAPTLRDGQVVLVDMRALSGCGPAAGDVLLVSHPYRDGVELIKRVERMQDDGSCFMIGDGGESTDSRAFGALPAELLLGVVVACFPG